MTQPHSLCRMKSTPMGMDCLGHCDGIYFYVDRHMLKVGAQEFAERVNGKVLADADTEYGQIPFLVFFQTVGPYVHNDDQWLDIRPQHQLEQYERSKVANAEFAARQS